MMCRHCKFQFCWMCRKNWDVHGYNDSVCNAFVEPPKSDQMNEASANLERWLFYYDHYTNHEQSATLDQNLVDEVDGKIALIQESSGLSWIEVRPLLLFLELCRERRYEDEHLEEIGMLL